MKIHQMSAGFQYGDAISSEMVSIASLLRSNGISGKIFADNIGYDPTSEASAGLPILNSQDILIYHYSIDSNLQGKLNNLKCRKWFVYHNVTPSQYFEPYDLKFSYLLREGRSQLKKMSNQFEKRFAVSKYNTLELKNLGWQGVETIPLHLRQLSSSKEFHSNKRNNFISVGRIAPNKRQDDLIRFMKVWKDLGLPKKKLTLIGFCNPSLTEYKSLLEFMIRLYDLEDTIEFKNQVTEAELIQMYCESEALISMSEHEGFCVPILEAMQNELPVFAFAGGAVEETMGGAGILFKKKDFKRLAFLINEILTDLPFKNELIISQKERWENYKTYQNTNNILKYI